MIRLQKAWALGAVAIVATIAACSGAEPGVAAKGSSSAPTGIPAEPPSGVLKLLEASRHVDSVERARCAAANHGGLGTWPILATATTTFGGVRTAMNTQFGVSSTRHLPFAVNESVILCLVKPPANPTPEAGEPNAATLVLAVGADGST